jgi:hypothetical protein
MYTMYFNRLPNENIAQFIERINSMVKVIAQDKILSVIIEKFHASISCLAK